MTARAQRQRGSVLVLVGAMSMLLIAFTGLSVDGGEIEAQQRQSQNAADGATMAAATAIINADNYGYTTSDATNIGDTVASFNGVPITDVTLSYLDVNGFATTDPTAVITVKATVTHNFPTLFLPIMGIDSASVSAQAAVTINQVPAGCAICILNPTVTQAMDLDFYATVTASGGTIRVLSNNAGGALDVDNGASLTTTGSPQPAITSVGPVTGLFGVGSISPTPTTGAGQTFTDPLAAVPSPSLGSIGLPVTYSSTQTIHPGTYGATTITGSGTVVTMAPGLYIFNSGLTVNAGATLNGSGVILYFACTVNGNKAGACSSPTDPGDSSIMGTMTVSAPAAGSDFTGLVWYADRNNTATVTVGGTFAPTGTIYGASQYFYMNAGTNNGFTSRLIIGQLDIDFGGTVAVTYTKSGNYVAPGKLKLTT